ncbi:MAG: hypothetical protein ABIR50_06525 [Ginsengibacter sp.]
MKKLLFLLLIITSCNNSAHEIDNAHIENLAKDFMKTTVIPKMKDPKPYEVLGAKTVVKTVADVIKDYQFIYDHFSLNDYDSIEHKKQLDSIINISKNPDSVISVTVNVSYKTRYKLGDIVTDSIKLVYDRKNDKITYWPF